MTDLHMLSQQAAQLLAEHQDTMLQFSPDQIHDYVSKGLAVALPHPQHPQTLAAFAKLYRWPGLNEKKQVLYELGSWVVPDAYQGHGFGLQAMHEVIAIGKQTSPGCQIVGVTEHTNYRSKHIMLKAGGELLDPAQWPSNFEVVLHDGQAQVVVIDLTNL